MPSHITAGQLHHKVGFYKRVAASDGMGNTQGEFAASPEFAAVRAQIVPRLGGEQVLAGRLTGQNLVNITVRQSTNTRLVTVDWRAKNERSGEIFNIRSIIDPEQGSTGRGVFFEMLCEQGVAP